MHIKSSIILFLFILILMACMPLTNGYDQKINPDENIFPQMNITNNSLRDKTNTINLHDDYILIEEGRKLFADELYSDALSTFQNLSHLYENDSEILYYKGVSFLMIGDFISAESMLNRSISLNQSIDALFYFGLTEYGLEKYDESISLFKQYLDKRPDDSYAWYNLGQAYERTRNFDLALKAYNSSVLIDPLYAKPWFFIGQIYKDYGDNSKAIDAYENYTNLVPEDDVGWFYLSQAYYANKSHNESLDAIRNAIQINPNNRNYDEYYKYYNGTSENVMTDFIYSTPIPSFLPIIAILSICIISHRTRKK